MVDREKFEAWAADNTELSLIRTAYAFTEYDEQQYIDHDTNLAWMAYQAALASQQPADDGWIYWSGGENPPVRDEVIVDVKWSYGSIDEKQDAGEWRWSNWMNGPNIIAYRVVKP